jgi:hypothetical protein
MSTLATAMKSALQTAFGTVSTATGVTSTTNDVDVREWKRAACFELTRSQNRGRQALPKESCRESSLRVIVSLPQALLYMPRARKL